MMRDYKIRREVQNRERQFRHTDKKGKQMEKRQTTYREMSKKLDKELRTTNMNN